MYHNQTTRVVLFAVHSGYEFHVSVRSEGALALSGYVGHRCRHGGSLTLASPWRIGGAGGVGDSVDLVSGPTASTATR